MLTFWLSVFCGVSALVLFFFPWRAFLFMLGFWLVGPQNWIFRILRERGHLPPLKKHRRASLDTKSAADLKKDVDELRKAQPVFSSTHTQGNGEQQDADVDPREVHGVVVPYGPLMYQRFYDWPPEPLYAQIKPDTLDEARRQRALATLQRSAKRSTNNNSFVVEVGQEARPQISRGRSLRVGAAPRRRANTGEWPRPHFKTS
jgi:hypothetical protein